MKTAKSVILTLLLSFFLLNTSAYAINIAVGEEAPDFILKSLNGEFLSLNEYRGKIVVLVYWNPEQKRSFLALKDCQYLLNGYKEKGVQILSIIPESEDYTDARKILTDNEITFPVLIDKEMKIFGRYEVRVYPSTLIINKDGKVAYNIPGHSLSYKFSSEGYIKYMLGEIKEDGLSGMLNPIEKVTDESEVAAERNYNLALNFAEAELIELAVTTAKKSLESHPDFLKSIILLGFLYIRTNDADSAVQEFNKALEIDPLSHDAKTGLGEALILKGDIDNAIKILSDTTQQNPNPQRTFYELGKAYELKDEKEKAIAMYRKAFEEANKGNVLPRMVVGCK
ncbi:MAG: redoxin domain-containing protein [Thermodesulfovibrionia bacterium]|nr:redoxin domain-containing protein [Thermodesulfovibrionia bacterium]